MPLQRADDNATPSGWRQCHSIRLKTMSLHRVEPCNGSFLHANCTIVQIYIYIYILVYKTQTKSLFTEFIIKIITCFILVILLSVFRFTTSDYHFGILDLRLLTTTLVSWNISYVNCLWLTVSYEYQTLLFIVLEWKIYRKHNLFYCSHFLY